MSTVGTEGPRQGLSAALAACPPEHRAAFHADLAVALAEAARTGDDVALRAVVERWSAITTSATTPRRR